MKLSVSLFQPTATPEHVIQLVGMQLEPLRQPGNTAKRRQHPFSQRPWQPLMQLHGQPIEVNEISVAVTSAVLLTQRQRQLFDENPRLDRQSLAHLINRLSGRLGRHRVVYPTLVSGAQPEHAFQFRPLVNPHHRQPRRTAAKTAGGHHSYVMARPLKMFQPSIELQTVALSTNHGFDAAPPPALLVFCNQRQAVTKHWGPERIETGWWRGSTIRRDYWRVETDNGQQFWIYHDLRKHAWFLHGEF